MSREKGTTPSWMTKLKIENFPKVQNVQFPFPLSLLIIIPSHQPFSPRLFSPIGLIVYRSS